MKKIILLLIVSLINIQLLLANQPLWLRYPSISPDGKTIVFSFQGNIFKVSSSGGNAIPLTLNDAHDFMPVWSPDGKSIAFASNRYGNFDIFVMPSDGGKEHRLTFYSGNEYPTSITPDNQCVLFTALIMDNSKSIQFPDSRFTELYKVPVAGGRVEQVHTTPAECAKYNKSKNILLYQDYKGYEDYWRKHHTSGVTRDIWIVKDGKIFQKLSSFKGEDREPVFSPDEQEIYYLSEEYGSFNVCKMSLNNPGESIQITYHEKHPVRFLSIAENGVICYSYNGKIFTKKPSEESKELSIEINYGSPVTDFEHLTVKSSATEMAVSPNGSEIAFIYRGDVFVTSTDYSTSKQITNTPEQERSVSFSPDGKAILYAGEKNGSWNIYQTKIKNPAEKLFCYSTVLVEEPIVKTENDEFQPQYSPDGAEVAYLEERTSIKIKNLQTGKTRMVFDGSKQYSYADGDQKFEWSPNGNWLLYSSENNLFLSNIYLINAKTISSPIDLTQSGYNDTKPKWGMNGEMFIWTSDKESMRKQAVWWGAQADIYAAFFDQKAYDVFKLSEEDYNASDKKSLTYSFDEKSTDFKNSLDRKLKLTKDAKIITDLHLTKDGKSLFYLVSTPKQHELWVTNTRTKTSKMATNFQGSGNTGSLWKNKSDGTKIYADKEDKNIYTFIKGSIYKVDAKTYKMSKISYNASMTVDKAKERQYLFEHVWLQVAKKFYNTNLHNVDWKFYKAEYEKFLPFINNGFDFSEMMSEMLGELNGSHTGCRYYPSVKGADKTARLGLFFDYSNKENGIIITDVLGKGPFDNADTKVTKGTVLLEIDGSPLGKNHNDFEFLNHKSGKNVSLSFYNPKTKQKWSETVKPISIYDEQELLYWRWFKIMRNQTERLSEGKIGYVHVRSMSDASLREVYSDALGMNKDKEAVIIDTRSNGGGWIHDDLVDLFNGQVYLNFNIRGVPFGNEPMNKWSKKSIVIMSEDNYSDANGFPYAYKKSGIGKLLGAPVAGTMTAVWWERLMTNEFVFGIPQVGTQNLKGEYLENKTLEPDYLVLNRNEMVSNGHDEQLEKAVEVLLDEIKSGK